MLSEKLKHNLRCHAQSKASFLTVVEKKYVPATQAPFWGKLLWTDYWEFQISKNWTVAGNYLLSEFKSHIQKIQIMVGLTV